jgi:hypothetical protein
MRFILVFGLAFCLSSPTLAQSKKLNTNLYEKEEVEDKTTSFSAKVRVVRDISDDVEVFFDSDKASGAYTLPHGAANYATMLKKLEDSREAGGGFVSVTADSDKRIKSVESAAKGKAVKDSGNPWKVDVPDF